MKKMKKLWVYIDLKDYWKYILKKEWEEKIFLYKNNFLGDRKVFCVNFIFLYREVVSFNYWGWYNFKVLRV